VSSTNFLLLGLVALAVGSACGTTQKRASDVTQTNEHELASPYPIDEWMTPWETKVKNAVSRVERVLRFRTGSSQLSAEAHEELRRLSSLLIQRPDEKVILKGYSDRVGEAKVDRELSMARMSAVRDAMLAQGVRTDQVILSTGEVSPSTAPSETASANGKSGTIEIEWTPPSG
jgi:outer membrane protein OmpA-like peptidoglycan-associated protein